MVYRTIVENFNESHLHPFWIPTIYDNTNAYVEIDTDDNFVTCFCNTAVGDSAAIRSMFPVCGNYLLWTRFRIDAVASDSDFLTIYDATTLPKPDIFATLQNTMKLECFFDIAAAPDEIEAYYYNTSNVKTNLDIDNDAPIDTWYWLRVLKDATNYTVTIYRDSFVVLTGPSSIALSSVNNGANPDYIVFGTLANDDHQIDLDLSYISLKYDPHINNYSNSMYYSNNYFWGV